MSDDKFPAGWDSERIHRVLAHYDQQNEDEALLEDEAAMAPSETVMTVPHDLVAKVRQMIAKRDD